MKNNVTYVPIDEMLNRVKDAGFKLEEKASWYKVAGAGGKIYIPMRKSVGRVDVSDFAKGDCVIPLDEDEKHGAITHILNQGKEGGTDAPTLEQVLANFDDLLQQLAATTAPVKTERPARKVTTVEDERKKTSDSRKELLKMSAAKAREDRAARAQHALANLSPVEIDDVPEPVEDDEVEEASEEDLVESE